MKLVDIQNGLAIAVKLASIRAGTPQYAVRDDAGSMTDADMIRAYRATGKLVIWSGASDNTVFGDASINWLFRAWHDFSHIRSGVCNREHGPLGCFEPIAEYAVADWQCVGLSDSLAKIVQLEVSGQARHFATTGKFIVDQVAYTLEAFNER